VLSVHRRETNDESKTTAATNQHDFHQCRSEICWQIRRQARRRHYYDDGESYRSNHFQSTELADESTYLWFTSEQMGLPLRPTGGGEHEERAKDLDSSPKVREHLVAYHLAPTLYHNH